MRQKDVAAQDGRTVDLIVVILPYEIYILGRLQFLAPEAVENREFDIFKPCYGHSRVEFECRHYRLSAHDSRFAEREFEKYVFRRDLAVFRSVALLRPVSVSAAAAGRVSCNDLNAQRLGGVLLAVYLYACRRNRCHTGLAGPHHYGVIYLKHISPYAVHNIGARHSRRHGTGEKFESRKFGSGKLLHFGIRSIDDSENLVFFNDIGCIHSKVLRISRYSGKREEHKCRQPYHQCFRFIHNYQFFSL